MENGGMLRCQSDDLWSRVISQRAMRCPWRKRWQGWAVFSKEILDRWEEGAKIPLGNMV